MRLQIDTESKIIRVEGTMLRAKPKKQSHVRDIDGVFCNRDCLAAFLAKD